MRSRPLCRPSAVMRGLSTTTSMTWSRKTRARNSSLRTKMPCPWGAALSTHVFPPFSLILAALPNVAARARVAVLRDYQAMPHLDRYAGSELASQSESMDASVEAAARRAAERTMRDRDRREGRVAGAGIRRPGALQESGARARPGPICCLAGESVTTIIEPCPPSQRMATRAVPADAAVCAGTALQPVIWWAMRMRCAVFAIPKFILLAASACKGGSEPAP